MPETGERLGRPAVLALHKLSPRLSFDSTNLSPARFRSLLLALCDWGYRFVPVDCPIPADSIPRTVAFSFDDAYAHLLDSLPPLIEEFGLSPTIFAPTAFLGQENTWDYSHALRAERHLSAPEMRTLALMGVRFGSHGHSHIPLTNCTPDQVRRELDHSKSILEDSIGERVTALSYPFGRTNSYVTAIAAELGYLTAYTMGFPTESDGDLSLGRYGAWAFDTPLTVRRKLTPGWLREIERAKARITNSLSRGTEWWRLLSRRRRDRAFAPN